MPDIAAPVTATPESNLSPAPVADATPKSWDAIVAEANGSPATGAEQGAAAPAATDWDEPAPPRPQSLHERLLAKHARDQERAKAQPIEQQLAAERQRTASLTAAQQHAEAEFQRLYQAGDIDGALKVRGLTQGFRELNTRYLQAQGALPPSDPRYEALEKELKTFRDEKAQTAKQQQEYRARQEAEQEYQRGIADLKAEIKALPQKGADKLAGTSGFADATFQLMLSQPGLTSAQAAATVRSDYFALYKELHSVFDDQPVAQMVEVNPARSGVSSASRPQSGVAPVTSLPPSGSAPITPPANETPEERWKRITRTAATLQG